MTALDDALADPDPSIRLNAVMAAGIEPNPAMSMLWWSAAQ